MQVTQYRIVFDGELEPGMLAETVKANLAKLFKSDLQKIEQLFGQGPVNIKRDLSEAEAEELSVGVLIDALGLEASHVSQHLRVLRGYDLVTSERRASQVYYRLAHHSVVDMLSAARTLLGELLESRAALIAD